MTLPNPYLRTATALLFLLILMTCVPLTDNELPNPTPPPNPTPDPTPTPVSILELAIWPDNATVNVGQSIQFCALARLSDNPTIWIALPSETTPTPIICLAAAQERNQG